MSDYQQEYWSEAISCALEDVGKLDQFTAPEIECVAKSMRVSAEMQGQAFGWDVASANLSAHRDREMDDLRKALRREQDMITCRDCNGTGTLVSAFGPWVSRSRCEKCQGHGRHDL